MQMSFYFLMILSAFVLLMKNNEAVEKTWCLLLFHQQPSESKWLNSI